MFKAYVFCLIAFVAFANAAYGQSTAVAPDLRFTIIPLTVEKGFPLDVILTTKLKFKVNEHVYGKIAEPVYAYDREVIPAGVVVEGIVTGFQKGGTWARVSSLLNGDFTPVRTPNIRFDTLVLEDGTRLPIETTVEPGTGTLVRFNSALQTKQRGGRLQAYTAAGKQSGNELVKGMLWGVAPYRPQSLPAGIRYRATLTKGLDFGNAIVRDGSLDRVGTEVPEGSVIYARLETPLNSRTATVGTKVEAVLTNPLFSSDHMLAYPVGSRLTGEVTRTRRAGRLQHTGELAFQFTKIEAPVSVLTAWQPQTIDGHTVAVQVDSDLSRLRIDEVGNFRIATSKERFVAPAFAMLGLARGFNADSQAFGQALMGAYSSNFFKRLLVGSAGSGLGLPAGIAGRMIPPVGIGLGVFSAARSIFINILSRGQEIAFPVNTPIEIRVGEQ